MSQQEQAKKWGQIVAKCWADEAFKARFKAEPAAVFKEYGLEVPRGLKVVENSPEVSYIVLPAKPTNLSDKQLEDIVGGSNWYVNDRPVVSMPYVD
ncbi:MAG: hypothetical protein H6Q72_3977 [Firmicutes bacterium]|nr:hypothetical protein [Bacillota bacterium]